MLWGAVCFAAGVAICDVLFLPLWTLFAALACAGVALWLLRGRRPWQAVAFCLALFCLGGMRMQANWKLPAIDALAQGREFVVSGALDFAPSVQDDRIQCTLVDAALDGQPIEGKVLLRLLPKGHDTLACGDVVRVRAYVRQPVGAKYPGGFDAAQYYEGQGVSCLAYAGTTEYAVIGHRDTGLTGLFAEVNSSIRRALLSMFQKDQAALATGMLLGDTDTMDAEELQSFRDAGVAHTLAVSGLHVGMLAGVLAWLLKRLRVRMGVQWLLLAVLLGLYCGITGFTPSVLRATIMTLVVLAGRVGARRMDRLSCLGLAAGIVLLIRPTDLFAAGFQLSFCAVLGIMLLQRPWSGWLRRKGHFPKWLADSLSLTLSAQAGILPVQISTFNSLSLVSVVANLALVPLVGVLFPLLWVCVLVYLLFPAVAQVLAAAAGFMMEVLSTVAALLAGLPFATLLLPSLSLALTLGFLALLWTMGAHTPWRGKTRAVVSVGLAGALLVGGLLPQMLPQKCSVTLLDGWGASCAVVRTVSGKAYLLDCGGDKEQQYDAGKSCIQPYLLKQGITHLDGIYLSSHRSGQADSAAYIAGQFGNPRIYTAVEMMPTFEAQLDAGVTLSAQQMGADDCLFTVRTGGVAIDYLSVKLVEFVPEGDCDALLWARQYVAGEDLDALVAKRLPEAVAVLSPSSYGDPPATQAAVYTVEADGCVQWTLEQGSLTVCAPLASP